MTAMNMTASEHEAFWTARYEAAGDDYLFGTAPSRFIAAHASLFESGATALSVADGEGRNSVWLAQQGLTVTALEISPAALSKARKLAAANRVAVAFRQADVLALEWPHAAYDFVVGVFIQFATPDERTILLAGMQQAVKSGGLLMLHGYTPKQLEYGTGGPSAGENLYTSAMLKDAFAADEWELLELREYEDELSEGTAHRGRSALIDLVARRKAA